MKSCSHSTSLLRLRSGFSLFEVLMFIAILGVILGMAVPMIGQNDAIYAARDRRNAQELCSTCTMARAAEVNFVQDNSVVDTVRAIVRGGMSVRGAMKGRLFVVPGLSEEDIQGAAKYLRIQNGELLYTSTEIAQPGKQQF
ncbi:hypothetical protein [Prosthecobacter sp.]|uniref:type II secretion system protein n=1 Tax=Prosthecobacter sp. TaxID=1965333 RepID=UPI001D2678A5|nr:hypothetical protein [Prosthecobacter sp.]MCB1278410.1 hypothetical protein [Prosthecobacter sp.]